MLPLALALAAKNKAGNSTPANPQTVKLIVGAVFALIAGVGGFFWWRNKKAQAQAALLQNDVPTQQASALRNAMDGPGTNEAKIFKVIPQITDFAKVAAAYKNLTKGGNLETDLAAELSTEDYNKVMQLLQFKGRTKGNTGAGDASNVFVANHPGPKDLPVGSKVHLLWNGKRGLVPEIFLYLDVLRYPSSPVVTKRPADYKPKHFGTVKGFKEISYGTGNTKMVLVNVIADNGQNFWVRIVDLGKLVTQTPPKPKTLKGILGSNSVYYFAN